MLDESFTHKTHLLIIQVEEFLKTVIEFIRVMFENIYNLFGQLLPHNLIESRINH